MANRQKTSIEEVDLDSIQILVELIGNRSTLEKELLKRRFGERARSFEETLSFMKKMQVLQERGRKIYRGRNLDRMQAVLNVGEQEFKKHLVKLIVDSPSRYGREMREVLIAFRLEEGKAWLNKENSGGIHYATRNIFLTADVIRLDNDIGMYTINSWFLPFFVRACYGHGTSPDTLKKLLKENADIGLEAELQVFKFEIDVVGQRDAEQVVHIALENTNAGFDIASTRRDQLTDQLRIRLIEVKAVSPRNWSFTLTRNEYRVAKENSDSYFLYLVPVIAGTPEVSKMQMIQDPIMKLQDQDKWIIREGDWNVSMVNKNV